MGLMQISGEVFPLVIDQAHITAPDFPRGPDWWERFMPTNWITVEVRQDGAVALDASPYRSHFTDGAWTAGERLTAAEFRRRRAAMVRWVNQCGLRSHLKTEEG